MADFSVLVLALSDRGVIFPLVLALLSMGALLVGALVGKRGILMVLDALDVGAPSAKQSRRIRDREIARMDRQDAGWRRRNEDRLRRKYFG